MLGAQAKAIESSLWLKVHYNVISELRKRIAAAKPDARSRELQQKASALSRP